MGRKRISVGLSVLGALFLGLLGLALAITTEPAHGKTTGATIINVTAGAPDELAFKLSKFSALPVGTVTFKVKNAGTVAHDFKVCTAAVAGLPRNTCVGKGTKTIPPGQSATLTVTFKKAGKYEYLCTVSGHAAAGMKGLVGIGVKVAGGTPVATTTTGSTPGGGKTTTGGTTTTGGATETLVGDPANGASVWTSAGCGACHTLRAARATGTVGPNLDDSKPGQDLVIQRVTNGINAMPSFANQLSSQQIKDVASYVYKSTHS